jgi:hypothetical protein
MNDGKDIDMDNFSIEEEPTMIEEDQEGGKL